MATDYPPMISFSDEMNAPEWNKYWDFLHDENESVKEWGILEGKYQSNCKNFQIEWAALTDFIQEEGWVDFWWYSIRVVGKARHTEDKGYVLFESTLPDNRSACLDMVKFWMTSERETDLLVNANAMLIAVEDGNHTADFKLVDYELSEDLAATDMIDYLDYMAEKSA